MNIELGTLKFFYPHERTDLLADPVASFISSLQKTDVMGVTEIDPELSDTGKFCEHYQVGMNQAANCIVLEAKRADKKWFAACVVLGNMRADINGIIRRTLDARRVSFAPMDQAVAQTGMEYGAITPVGLPNNWSLLIDKTVVDSNYVIIGSGLRKSKLAVPGSFLASLPNAQIIENLANNQEKTT